MKFVGGKVFGWLGKENAGPLFYQRGKRDCIFLESCETVECWQVAISGSLEKDRISYRNSHPRLESLIRHALETQEFYALSDYLNENFPEHPVTKLLTEIVMEGQKV